MKFILVFLILLPSVTMAEQFKEQVFFAMKCEYFGSPNISHGTYHVMRPLKIDGQTIQQTRIDFSAGYTLYLEYSDDQKLKAYLKDFNNFEVLDTVAESFEGKIQGDFKFKLVNEFEHSLKFNCELVPLRDYAPFWN